MILLCTLMTEEKRCPVSLRKPVIVSEIIKYLSTLLHTERETLIRRRGQLPPWTGSHVLRFTFAYKVCMRADYNVH